MHAQGRNFFRSKAATALPGVRPAAKPVCYNAKADLLRKVELRWWWISARGSAPGFCEPPRGFNATAQVAEARQPGNRNTLATTRLTAIALAVSVCKPNTRTPRLAAASAAEKRGAVKAPTSPLRYIKKKYKTHLPAFSVAQCSDTCMTLTCGSQWDIDILVVQNGDSRTLRASASSVRPPRLFARIECACS